MAGDPTAVHAAGLIVLHSGLLVNASERKAVKRLGCLGGLTRCRLLWPAPGAIAERVSKEEEVVLHVHPTRHEYTANAIRTTTTIAMIHQIDIAPNPRVELAFAYS